MMSKINQPDRHHLVVASLSIVSLLSIGTFLFSWLENWTLAQSFYFSAITLTTIGYGDIHPTHDYSRIAAAIYALVGVGIMAASVTVIATDRINEAAKRMRNIAEARKEKSE